MSESALMLAWLELRQQAREARARLYGAETEAERLRAGAELAVVLSELQHPAFRGLSSV